MVKTKAIQSTTIFFFRKHAKIEKKLTMKAWTKINYNKDGVRIKTKMAIYISKIKFWDSNFFDERNNLWNIYSHDFSCLLLNHQIYKIKSVQR